MASHDLTVVIPAYNAGSFIQEAILSAKEVGAAQIVVVDDGSTDDTAVRAEELGCKVIRQENAGAAEARQSGIASVSTSVVILLDADDALVPAGVKKSLKMANHDSGWAFVAGATLARGTGHSSVISPWPEGVSVNSLLARGHSVGPPGAFLWRTSVLKRAMEEDPPALRPRYAEDYELLIRGAMFGSVVSHKEIACVYASEGGKSAIAPLRSNAAAEEIRRFYAKALNLEIRERSDRELESMAYLRMAYGAPKRSFRRFMLYVKAAGKSPMFFPSLVVRKIRRIWQASRI